MKLIKIKQFNAVSDDLGQTLDNSLQAFAQETGQISYQDIINYGKKLANAKNNAKLQYHLNKWNEYIESGQDDKALKKSDDIRAMIRGQKEFSLRRFSDSDKMLFVEYVDEDGDTTRQVMKESEFKEVKSEAEINKTSGAKIKILTEEEYDETNPKHKKYKKHPEVETKEFSDREQVPQYIADEVDKNGVIVKYKDDWRIVSKKQKPYEFWDAHYDTREDAEKALDAYHANKGFSEKSKLFGYDDYDPSELVWGWMLHCISDGKEMIYYNSDGLESKSVAKEDLEDMISDGQIPVEKVLHKRVVKCDGTDFISEWEDKYPDAKVEGV